MVKRLRNGKLQFRSSPKRRVSQLAKISKLSRRLNTNSVSTSALTAAPNNARRHSERQISQIAASIHEFGFLAPIIADSDGHVIAGHGRLAAAKQLGLAEVPVVRVDHLTSDQIRAYRLADNRLAELSSWDRELLRIELEELSVVELPFAFEVTGFDTADVDRHALAIANPARDPADDLPTVATTAVSRLGDVWKLGSHLILCGDASDPASYSALLGTTKVEMLLTDPPYNVPVVGHVTSKARHREFPMASGEMSQQQFAGFLERCFRLMHQSSRDGAIHFICMDWRHIPELLTAASPVYGEPKQLCVWAKEHAGMGSFYRSQHELVFVFKVGDASHINNFGLGERGRYRTNVWRYAAPTSRVRAKDNSAAEHPTVKPVAMFADAIKDCSRRGGIVLDPFGGSGTTLISADRTKRRARLIELDPLYVDLTIRRWQAHSGLPAIHAQSGRSFDDFERGRRD